MVKRALPLVLAAFVLIGAANALRAQTLTPSQRATLDGRFERVLRAEAQGTLRETIEAVPGGTKRRPVQQRPRRPGVSVKSEGPDRTETFALASPVDVRPIAYRADGTPVYEATVHTRSEDGLEAPGVQVLSAFNEFATVRATPAGLRALSRSERVSRVQSSRRVHLHNDEAAAEVGARTLNQGVGGTPYQGQDVMACVIDSGIDWSHPDFTDASGRTRIHSIWDQADDSTSVPSPAETDGGRFGENFNPQYGAEYLTRDIREDDVLQKDRNGHGTHVAGTVASSGQAFRQSSGTRKYRGVAPAASIIAVKTAFTGNAIVDAVNYCADVAASEGRPVVVNMSLGTDFGPHDGTAPFARALDAIASQGAATGTVIVTSAGNSGDPGSPIHVSGSVAAGDSADVPFDVPAYEPRPGGLNDVFLTTLWTYQDGPYSLSVYTPDDQDAFTFSVEASDAVRDTLVDTPRGTISVTSAPSGSARYFEVEAFDQNEDQPPAEGTWTLRLRSEGEQSTTYHGWSLGSSMGAAFQNADNRYTIGIPATSRSAIAVGAYVQRNRWATVEGDPAGLASSYERDQTAPFSSRGPTVDGRQKPAITAPGAFTASAFSDDAFGPLFGPGFVVGDGEHQLVSGTSMSAPVVAGTAALLLQEDPSLSANEVRSLMTATARADDAVGDETWNETYGFGKLDALGAMTRLRDDLSTSSTEVLAYEDAFDRQQEAAEAVGADGAERLAVRFTPTQAGALTGMYLSLGGSASPNDLRDSLVVRVWSDDGSGVPDAPMGDSVVVPRTRLAAHTPNHVSLRDAEVALQADSDYHLVLKPKPDGGTLDVLAETAGESAGRSSAFDGSAWSDTENDLVVRPQVGGGLSTQDRTPPLPSGSPSTAAAPDSIVVDWGAFSAQDVRRYYVYRDTTAIDSAAGPGGMMPLDSVAAPRTQYVDSNVELGTQYHYRVAAVDDAGNTSGFTGESTATPRLPPDIAAPASVEQTFDLGASETATLQVENAAADGGRPLTFSAYAVTAGVEKAMAAQKVAQSAPPWRTLRDYGAKAGGADASTRSLPHTSSLPVILSDPTGDAAKGVDVSQVRAGVEAGSLKVAIEHTASITPSNYAAVLSLDVDQDTSTGAQPTAANPEQTLGAEYEIVLSDVERGIGFLVEPEGAQSGTDGDQVVTQVPVATDGATVHFAAPLSEIDGTLPFNATGVMGTRDQPTDWVPNAGNAAIGGVEWLAVSPQSGEVAAGEAQSLTLTFDASQRAPGTYEALVRLQSNDPDEETTDVPVSMTVEGLSPPSGLTATTEGADVALDWNAPSGGTATQYKVYRRPVRIPDDGADQSPVGRVSGQTSFTDTTATAGRTYHYRVSAVNEAGAETALSPERVIFLYPEIVEANVDRSFGGGVGTANYRLVALPGAVDRPVADAVQGESGLDWQAYWDDGDGLVKFDTEKSESFTFRPGRGFWLTSAEAWTVQDEIETVSLKGDTATTIPLHEGWNIVSNPTGKPVSQRDLRRANPDASVDLVGFDGAFQLADTMRSGRTGVAYYYLNEAGLDSLTIPYPGAPTPKSSSKPADDQTLALLARPRDGSESVVSTVRIGLDSEAREGIDQRDRVAPPGRFEAVSLRLDAPESLRAERHSGLLVEQRPPPSGTGPDAGRTFDLRVRARTEGPIRLNARNLDALGDRAVALLNVDTGAAHDLRTTSSLTLDPRDETALRLAVGSPAYVRRQAEQVAPDEVALTSYPNPMHRQGTLEYAVPEETTVRLEVYDLLGRKVATLVNQRKEAGRYRVQIETDRLSSGVYFGRLRTGDQTRTQKMTIVR